MLLQAGMHTNVMSVDFLARSITYGLFTTLDFVYHRAFSSKTRAFACYYRAESTERARVSYMHAACLRRDGPQFSETAHTRFPADSRSTARRGDADSNVTFPSKTPRARAGCVRARARGICTSAQLPAAAVRMKCSTKCQGRDFEVSSSLFYGGVVC